MVIISFFRYRHYFGPPSNDYNYYSIHRQQGMLVADRNWYQKAGSGSLTTTPKHPLFCYNPAAVVLASSDRDSLILKISPCPPIW